MLKNLVRILGGDPHQKEIETHSLIVDQINALESSIESLSDEELSAKTEEFKDRLRNGESLDDLLPEAFAVVRETSKRTIGLRHYDIQLLGGIVLHQGEIAEMRTGEGKTLVATLPLYLNALSGKGVHLVTVNDYLARRDARWMAPIYDKLGMSVGVLQMASRTESGRKGFIVDLENRSNQEDQDQLRIIHRREAYQADITYGTNNEFGFDYLRDNLTMRLSDRVQRKHNFAIIDEVDNVLIDEARTPLIISGPAHEEVEWYERMAQVVRQLKPEDYEINERDRNVSLTEIGEAHIEELLNMALRDPERPEDITPEQARVLGHLEQALRAHHLFKRNKDYLVQAGKVVIVDEFTGRLMPGRRWSEGLHQAVEAKEGVKVEPENVTYATITLQNYFRMYEKLSGMTGTALTEAEEFSKIYNLDVLPVPTNLEFVAAKPETEIEAVDDKDEQGYKHTYYVSKNDSEQSPLFWKRKDYPDVVYRSGEAKLRAIIQEIIQYHIMGRPQLIGTTSVEHSDILSERLKPEPTRRLMQILLIRYAWMVKNDVPMIDRSVPELEPLQKPLNELGTNDLRPLAKEFGISLNPEDSDNLKSLQKILSVQPDNIDRLIQVIKGGIPHRVLNARKHDEESQIIAGAGSFGAVTIATNMAGRGVDIKLGGELPEEIIRDTNRVLGKAGLDPFGMTNEERFQALQSVDHELFGIYEESVNQFIDYINNMKRVRDLGGLHVIGSERHESRRIDNQLRGRAARQGDPGSSRFYLSLEDDLMRLFGGQQVENLWKRIFFDESMPLEMNIIGRIVEQSQERVEGANFDVRKHLLEYDDVLNSQRQRIYDQRDKVFIKPELQEDILDMLHIELQKRIPLALEDEEGPWKLLAYLEEIQPAIEYEHISYPSFPVQLLLDEINSKISSNSPTKEEYQKTLLSLAEDALEAELDHHSNGIKQVLANTQNNLELQINERLETLDTYIDTISYQSDTEQKFQPQEMMTELSSMVRVPLKLKNEDLQNLIEADDEAIDSVRSQIEDYLISVNIKRLVGAIERRLEESLELKSTDIDNKDWSDITNSILDSVEHIFSQRKTRLFGSDGQIVVDLSNTLEKLDSANISNRQLLSILTTIAQGSKLAFDPKTHRKARKRYVRIKYVYLAAKLLGDAEPQSITERILDHFENGLTKLQEARGFFTWNKIRLAEATLSQLEPQVQVVLQKSIGSEDFSSLSLKSLESFSESEKNTIIEVIGKYLQNEAYRELLLRVISDQWVEYLTKVDALRVSIGLEAYAQRDPLVQYKSKATEMFAELLADIRMGVISRLFTFQIRRVQQSNIEVDRERSEEQPSSEASGDSQSSSQSKKRRRRRRK